MNHVCLAGVLVKNCLFMRNIFALLLVGVSVGVVAQPLRTTSHVDSQMDSLKAEHKVIYINGRPTVESQAHIDSVRHMIDMFYYDQFRSFADPAAPYFLFMSKGADLSMGVGGCVRMRGWYDWNGSIPANGFIPYLIPVHPNPASMRRFATTPAGSSLFFRVIGRNKKLGNYQLYIEANFNGYKGLGFQLKKAYATLNDWTIGYAASTFSDPASVVPTVDAAGPNNELSTTAVLVRWMHTWRERWTLAASAETPATQIATDPTHNEAITNWIPDFAMFGQYAWGRSEHIRLAGIVRSLSYRNLITQRNHNLVGWGAQLSGVWHPARPLTVYGNINGGAGYESLMGDLQTEPNDLVPDPADPQKLYAPYALGWNVGLQYNFRPNLFAAVGYSECRYFPRSGTAGDTYKYGQYVVANIFWNITPRIQTAFEFDTGLRRNRNGEHRRAYRLGLLAQFSF